MKKVLTLTLKLAVATIALTSVAACNSTHSSKMAMNSSDDMPNYYAPPAPKDVAVNETFRDVNKRQFAAYQPREHMPSIETRGKLG